MIRKVFSPIIYAACIFFVFIVEIIIYGVHSGIRTVYENIMISIVSSPIFVSANYGMVKIERMTKPTMYDHFRQTSLFYLLVGVALFNLLFKNTDTMSGMPIWLLPIIINAIFLYFMRSPNVS
jgi:TRAP-type C4-dicarboxylate transport system permease large subunit